MRAFVRAAVLCLALLAGPALGQGAALVKLDAATQARLGIVTAPLPAARRTASVSGFARALDPVPLAQLDSDIATAVAALAASQAEANRTRALNAADQTVSRQAAETAAAQARGDAAKLQLLRRRVGLEWSPALARLSDARRSRLVADIAGGRAALVRIDAASGLTQFTGSAIIALPSGAVHAAILGPTRVGDPRLQATGLLALVTGPAAVQLGTGAVASATVSHGPDAPGVVIPRAALLRTGGQTFVFVRRDATNFERRVVPPGASDPDGLFVTSGFKAGEPVVTAGASQLFAAQSGPAKGE
ncbi:hypothetical protein [Phenylobacterium sp.]|uniref:hypothetical protein n=1 Tax=Phenylobacterium sp. TaxID=1871053 RepID=UPI0035648582